MQIYHVAARRREKYYTKQFSKVGKAAIVFHWLIMGEQNTTSGGHIFVNNYTYM